MKTVSRLFLGLIMVFCMLACSDEDSMSSSDSSVTNNSLDVTASTLSQKTHYEEEFAKLLSKAVFDNISVRKFIKNEALKKIDNDYDVFYPISKKGLIKDITFENVLKKYTSDSSLLDSIDRHIPLLNIHLLDFANIHVASMDTNDKYLPVLFNDKLFCNGVVVDSISSNEIPNFNVLVVTESNTIRRKTSLSSRSFSNDQLGESYEYVNPCFDPNTSYNQEIYTRSSGKETLTEKYSKGIISSSDIDPYLMKAYNVTRSNRRATRCAIYYGMDNLSDNPTVLKSNVSDYIFSMKVSNNSYKDFSDVATNNGDKPLLEKDITVKKHPLSIEDAISRLMTGRSYHFLFTFSQGSDKDGNLKTKDIDVYVAPNQLYNFTVNESRKHHTAFRHSKYTYSIDEKDVESKWFYPFENQESPEIGKWDLSKDPIEQTAVVYLVNPEEGDITTTTETYTMKYSNAASIGSSSEFNISKVTKLGISGKFDTSNSYDKTITRTIQKTAKNF